MSERGDSNAPRRPNVSQPRPQNGRPRQAAPGNGTGRPNVGRPTAGQRPRSGGDPRPNQQYDPRRIPNRDETRRRPTPEELRRREMARREAERRRAYEKEMRRRERKRNWKIFGGRFLVFLIVLALMLVAVGIGFLIHFTRTPHADPDSGKIRYYYGGELLRTPPIEDCIIDGVPFLCFNDLSDYLDMSETGGSDGLKFLFRNDSASDSSGSGKEEYVIFPTDSKEVNVNGQMIPMDGMNRIVVDEVWVQADFVSDYMRGLSVTYNAKKGEIRVARMVDEANSEGDDLVYLPVEFTLKSTQSMEGLPETDGMGIGQNPTEGDTDSPVYELDFINDLAEYEKYMDPADRDGFLTLVNTTNLLDKSYTPSDLMDCKYTAKGKSTQQLRLYANMALEALMKEMQAAGFYNMAVYSGFRSYSYQNVLFEQYTQNEMTNNPSLTREQAESIVLTYSTRPGTSEHQTGLAVDMDTMGTFSTEFENTAEYRWLQENAWKFGFILRFPKDKTYITTIQFEPWHYRFVGRYHAKRIHDSGMCLEEYVESLRH